MDPASRATHLLCTSQSVHGRSSWSVSEAIEIYLTYSSAEELSRGRCSVGGGGQSRWRLVGTGSLHSKQTLNVLVEISFSCAIKPV